MASKFTDDSQFWAEKCCIYVVKGPNGWRKIGITKHIKRRMAELQTSNYKRLVLESVIEFSSRDDADFIERYCHKLLNDCRDAERGEWFQIGPHSARNLVVGAAKQWGRSARIIFQHECLTMGKAQRVARERKKDAVYSKLRKKKKKIVRRQKQVAALLND